MENNVVTGEHKLSAALWRNDVGYCFEYFCPVCKEKVYRNGQCDCGTSIDLSLPMKPYCEVGRDLESAEQDILYEWKVTLLNGKSRCIKGVTCYQVVDQITDISEIKSIVRLD